MCPEGNKEWWRVIVWGVTLARAIREDFSEEVTFKAELRQMRRSHPTNSGRFAGGCGLIPGCGNSKRKDPVVGTRLAV